MKSSNILAIIYLTHILLCVIFAGAVTGLVLLGSTLVDRTLEARFREMADSVWHTSRLHLPAVSGLVRNVQARAVHVAVLDSSHYIEFPSPVFELFKMFGTGEDGVTVRSNAVPYWKDRGIAWVKVRSVLSHLFSHLIPRAKFNYRVAGDHFNRWGASLICDSDLYSDHSLNGVNHKIFPSFFIVEPRLDFHSQKWTMIQPKFSLIKQQGRLRYACAFFGSISSVVVGAIDEKCNECVDNDSSESKPSSPAKRILYAIVGVVLITVSATISFRLIVLGKNWFELDWLNIPLVFASLISGTCGIALIVKVLSEKF
jgi:hypothetical protein